MCDDIFFLSSLWALPLYLQSSLWLCFPWKTDTAYVSVQYGSEWLRKLALEPYRSGASPKSTTTQEILTLNTSKMGIKARAS